MDPHKITFIMCVNDEAQFREAVLYLRHLWIPSGMTAEILPIGGASSMCAGYEQGRLAAADAKYKVYMHQDVLVIRKNLIEELLQLFADPRVGLIGLAGCEQLPPSGIWWDGQGLHNKVAHALRAEHISVPSENVPKCRVQAVDGVLLATQYDIPWRADLLTGWHFYDISISQEYRGQGYEVMLPRQDEPWIIHQTKHSMAGEDYEEQRQIFLQAYRRFY
ncbi:hypothetical protein SAMN05216582_11338 [Selenomonas ruminantium]|uniref:Streptomycin biosynthesis protein StrF domain-containing protein n=1 Tax=Selenomonas ruminantium TaxID=971 RepID=A0A1M6UM84_SELRU|nr:glycosyltransferase family protein [Selenomonas ruminantium]SHK70243.1 hypothetical protein SAMN05216582_11338 [Selenomonas ruminantium]